MKNFLKKLWEILKKMFCFIVFLFASFFTVKLVKNKNKENEKKENEIKEDVKNEIKKTNAADLVNDSPNKDDIQQSIDNIQEDFRQRIRDRFNKTL